MIRMPDRYLKLFDGFSDYVIQGVHFFASLRNKYDVTDIIIVLNGSIFTLFHFLCTAAEKDYEV